MPSSVRPPSLLPWPNPRWKENPYQTILYAGLRKNGVRIRATPPAFSLLRYVPKPDWLHLNWPETLFRTPDSVKRDTQFARFVRTVEGLKRRGTRVLWTMHNESPHEAQDPAFHREATARLCELADLTHVHFPAALALLEEAYGVTGGAVHVTQHPHYGDYYGEPVSRLEARQGLGIDPGAHVVLVFGYLRRYKGVETAVESLQNTEDATLRLVVAGRVIDEGTADLLRLAAARDPRIILRLGHVTRSEVMPLFCGADAFLLPSRSFFTSGSLMLALTYGVPVIAAPLNHAATLEDRSFFNPWEPTTAQRLTEILDSLPAWLRGVPPDAFESVREEWDAVSLTVGLADRLRR